MKTFDAMCTTDLELTLSAYRHLHALYFKALSDNDQGKVINDIILSALNRLKELILAVESKIAAQS